MESSSTLLLSPIHGERSFCALFALDRQEAQIT